MTANKASFINAVILIGVGLWSATHTNWAPPSFIAPSIGLILLLLNNAIKSEKKISIQVAIVLSAFIGLLLLIPMKSAIEDGRMGAIVRISIMISSCIVAVFFLIKNVITLGRQQN